MKVFVLLIAALYAAEGNHFYYTAHEEAEWAFYRSQFHHEFSNPTEERYRKLIFAQHLNEIDEHNMLYEHGKTSFTMGFNNYTDQLHLEFMKAFPVPPKLPHKRYLEEIEYLD